MNPAQKRQTPPAGGADGEMRGNPVGQELRPYSYGEGKASGTKPVGWVVFQVLWLKQVRADPSLTTTAFAVAFDLLGFVDKEKRLAWPALDTLAERSRLSRSSVSAALDALVTNGHFIRKRGGRGASSRYQPILFDSQNAGNQKQGSTAFDSQNPPGFDSQPAGHEHVRTELVRGRAFSAPLTDSGKGGDSDSRVAASSAASEVPSKTGDVFSFEGLEWTVTSPPKFDPARGLSAFFAKNPDGLETDLTIDADGCIDRDIPF